MIHPQDLPKNLQTDVADLPGEEIPSGDLDSMERVMIERALKENGGHQAAAADALGISRRTLSRKIKAYQLEGTSTRSGGSLGFLNLEQYRYFRAAIDQPVLIRSSAGEEVRAESVNISSTGIGVRKMEEPQNFGGIVDLELNFIDSDPKMKLKGKLTWADAQGNAGIRFVSVPRKTQQLIDEWIEKKRSEEGWTRGV